ncbi:MAG: class I SAM-dependent methyltransferase [Eubacteriales bacterium]|nr:class I SAM-dependent methyltransferase [Eubacteriales bacterium]
MNIEEIKPRWNLRENNKQASIDMWDSMAQSFHEQSSPTFDENGFLQLLLSENMLDPETGVLDVGCGTGSYACAIAGKCEKVTGVDLSSKMIDFAVQKAKKQAVNNVEFYCMDWHQTDLKENGFEKSFDLVIAHMTPAVQSADTFLKLSQASRGWCVLSKPTRRTDPVSDEVKRLVGIAEKRESSDTDILYAFELLWLQGLQPQFRYERQHWNMEKTIDQACLLYINRVKTYRDITTEEEERIKSYLRSIAQNGMVREEVDTTITTMYWQV